MIKTPHKSFVIAYRNFALPLMKFIVKRLGGNQEAAEEVFARTVGEPGKAGTHSSIKVNFLPGFAELP